MAGESSLTRTYATLLTTTLDKIIQAGVIHDQVFTKNPFLSWLREGKRIKILDGGERVRVQLMYESNPTYTRYADYDQLDVTPSEGHTTAWFTWSQAAVTVAASGKEIRQNGGQSRISDIVKNKINQAMASLTEGVSTDVYSDGTASGSKQISGLAAMVATTTTSGTYASIDTAVNTAWRNQIQATVGAGAVNLIPKLRTAFNDCSQGQGAQTSPDFIMTTQAVHEIAEALLVPAVRYSGGEKADMSVDPYFRGVPIKWDDHCQSGVLYLLNGNHMFFFVHRDANFSMDDEGMQKPINQDARLTQILLQGNLGCDNRRKLGKLTGIT